MKKLILLPISLAAIILSGCSTTSKNDSAPTSTPPETASAPVPASAKSNPTSLEGSWRGRDVTPGQEGPATLKFVGQTVEFHGATDDDWLKGTFTLREDATPKQWIGVVTDCPSADAIGKKCYAIYKIEDGTLTIAGTPIGNEEFPTAFDASNARQFVFKHEQ
ncbi:MAG TPA: hypothetical protein VGO67_06125 [Verrucomicrobiae bacterium]|jgi:uncharacterized protein (TIGR03067 family)